MSEEYKRIGIFGKSQSGKSLMLDKIMLPHPRVVLFDVVNRAEKAKKQGFIQVKTVDELMKYVDHYYDDGFKLWLHPSMMDDMPKMASEMARRLMLFQEAYGGFHDIIVCVDEAASSVPNHRMKNDSDYFSMLCMNGRHVGLHLVGATQRPANVSTDFRGQLNIRYFFNLAEPADFQFVAKVGADKGKMLAEAVAKLKPLEYIRMQDGHFTFGKITFD